MATLAERPQTESRMGRRRVKLATSVVSRQQTFPNPGAYHVRDFLEEEDINPVQKTYGFKGQGRKKSVEIGARGMVLLPGAYNIADSFQQMEKRPATYCFKNSVRNTSETLGVRDKYVDVPPWQYSLIPAPVAKLPTKHAVFRSTVQRFPTTYFIPKEGPAPGHYEVRQGTQHPVTSCFQSKVPRFLPIRSKTPGPGTYAASRQGLKQAQPVAKMGRLHGLFFRNSFEV
ncbi:protein STPG4 isoform X3 [Latimeria chalumnae]|uniref:protein STPG4 isoform X3 n=1 Tax=Latimeria chalumnae TaxID=7897 RepID=UPI0003C17ACD|nr:PREDICTED: uncharacterized protein C2orf61 homolog isoform X2 [Latimeria chalumnae]|eukprot:XP_006003481.1 PREDICTED: uncharacterized protein C2orf61 homolog isoform X2 [Latimeria chalumnae]